jgi:hypothetical protein
MRDAVGADEVPAGSAWDDRKLDPGAPCNSVDDLVDRAVPADGDEQVSAVVGRLPCELCELARPLGEERVPGQPGGRSTIGDLRPAPSGGAVVCSRVDEEDGPPLANA